MKSINRAALVWLICWLMLLTVGCATTNKANLSNDEARESSRVQVTSQGTVFRNVGFYMIPILGDFLFATDIVNGVLDVKSEHPPQNELERNMIPSIGTAVKVKGDSRFMWVQDRNLLTKCAKVGVPDENGMVWNTQWVEFDKLEDVKI